MKNISIFAMRVVIGAFFAVVLTRLFFPGTNLIYAAGLGVFMVGMAYVLEYLRNGKMD